MLTIRAAESAACQGSGRPASKAAPRKTTQGLVRGNMPIKLPITTPSEHARVMMYRALLIAYLGYGPLGLAGWLFGALSPEGFVLWAVSAMAFGIGIIGFALWLFGLFPRPAALRARREMDRSFRSLHLPGQT